MAWRYLQLHAVLAPVQAPPLAFFQQQHDAVPPSQYSWWSWWDQRYYLEAALAWSQGVLDPAYHWYLPGYPMLGAPFAWLTPAEPFMVPDLACFLASLWLFAALAARVLGGMPYARSIGAAVFVATMALPERLLWAWVVPWTSTPQTPCILACLLATARFAERPRAGAAFAATLAGVTTAAFRPADAAIVMAVSGATLAWTMLRHRPTWPVVAAGFAGATVPSAIFGGAYLVLYGWHVSPYVALSNAIGFEWRLLPLRWVTLMIDPVPLLPDGRGLAAAFPWILPGIAGMAATIFRRERALHGLVAGAALLDCLVFLTYRDLHPTGLWRLGNYHYFKWMLPVFGLYAVLWLRLLVQAPRLAVVTGVGVAVALACWRGELTGGVALRSASAQVLELPAGLPHIRDAVLGAGIGDLAQLYQPGSQIRSGAATFDSFADFKVFSWSNLFLVVPLRPLPASPSTLRLAGAATVDPAVTPLLAHQSLVWGLPCWVAPARPVCRRQWLIPPLPLPADGTLSFAAGVSEPYQLDGWTPGDATGRWTEGGRASVLFATPAGTAAIMLTANGYVPAGAPPVEAEMSVNGRRVGAWHVGAAPMTMTAELPPGVIDPDGGGQLELRIVNPRRPSDYGASDPRDLGLFVTTMRAMALP